MGKFNALVVHGGAPTAVMNASLYGAVREAGKHGEIEHFYAAVGGSGAILRERFLDLKTVPDELVSLLPATPASAIGTSRLRPGTMPQSPGFFKSIISAMSFSTAATGRWIPAEKCTAPAARPGLRFR